MRTFNWNKLPVAKIWGKKNIWSLVIKNNEGKNTKGQSKIINFRFGHLAIFSGFFSFF